MNDSLGKNYVAQFVKFQCVITNNSKHNFAICIFNNIWIKDDFQFYFPRTDITFWPLLEGAFIQSYSKSIPWDNHEIILSNIQYFGNQTKVRKLTYYAIRTTSNLILWIFMQIFVWESRDVLGNYFHKIFLFYNNSIHALKQRKLNFLIKMHKFPPHFHIKIKASETIMTYK